MKKILNKIIQYLAGIRADRYMHFSVGAVVAAASYLIAAVFCCGPVAFGMSVLTVLTAAGWKELRYDTVADIWDFWVTMAGGAVVWTVLLFTT